jgi:hypothetical protein
MGVLPEMAPVHVQFEFASMWTCADSVATDEQLHEEGRKIRDQTLRSAPILSAHDIRARLFLAEVLTLITGSTPA